MFVRHSAIFVTVFTLLACGTQEDPPVQSAPDGPLVVATQSDSGLMVELLADKPLKVGLNQVYYRLADASGELVSSAHITQGPLMQMEMMSHAAPYTDPAMTADEDNLFASEIVFTMAGGMMGSWSLGVDVHDVEADSDHSVTFEDLEILETDMKKNLVVGEGDSETIYIITLNLLTDPVVGENDFILTVHQKETMMSFPAAEDFGIEIETLMPDMGHGSAGNVAPVYDASGRYSGTVVFSMTGLWTVDFNFQLDSSNVGTVSYDFNL